MKALIKTLDGACRIQPTNSEVLEPFRPSVVTITDFIKTLGMTGKIKDVGGGPLPDTATDAEFAKFFTDSDRDEDLAVSSFMSKVNKDLEEAGEPSMFEQLLSNSDFSVKANDNGQVTGFGANAEKPSDTVTETSAPKVEEKPVAESDKKPAAAVTQTAAPKGSK